MYIYTYIELIRSGLHNVCRCPPALLGLQYVSTLYLDVLPIAADAITIECMALEESHQAPNNYSKCDRREVAETTQNVHS